MILRSYALFDRKALTYSTPFFAATDGLATRSLKELVSDQNTSVGRHPADFVLYLIGSYDDQKGLISGIDPLVHVMDAISLVPPVAANLFNHPQDASASLRVVANALNGTATES